MGFINIRQHDMSDCGPACLAMVARYYRGSVSIAKIREQTGTNSMGTSLRALSDGAASIGFKPVAIKSVENEGEDCLSEVSLPCIAHMIVDEDLLHYVVIFKIKRNTIIISDPAEGIVEIPRDQFWGRKNCEIKSRRYRWSGALMLLSPTEKFKKDYKRFSTVKNLFQLLRPNKKLCISIVVISLVHTVLNISTAFYYMILIDKILPEYAFNSLVIISEAFLLLIIAKIILNILRVDMSLILGKHINQNLGMKFYEHILKLSQCFFDNRKVGEISSRFQDIEIVQTLLSKIVLTVFVDAISVIAAGYILYTQSLNMFIGIIVICLLYIVVVWIFKGKYSVYSRKQLVSEAQNNAKIIDFLSGALTTKLYRAEKFSYKSIEKSFTAYLENIYKLGKLENIQYALKDLIGLSGEIVILCLGAYNIFLGDMTIGGLITFNALIVYFLEPVRNLIDLQTELQTALVAEERIQEIMELEPEESRKKEETNHANAPFYNGYDVCFQNISFGYDPDKPVLEHFSLQIKSGAKIAIVGASGTGKSTIAKLLLKLYTFETGNISINGVDLKDISTEIIRNKIAYVSQDTSLFNISIRENLLLGNKDYDNINEIQKACKIVKIHDYIMSLPFQYDTVLEENGSNLSTGQKQRLMLARAILRKPQILLLDEATSNLDIELEKLVNNSIIDYLAKSTVVFITHRFETAQSCDSVFIVKDGQVKPI